MNQVENFELKLMDLNPKDDGFPSRVDVLVESITDDLHESLVPAIFRFFEHHPLEECGMPGGLVHLVENYYPKYKQILMDSLRRSPSNIAILMVNRILNSELSVSERNEYTTALLELCNGNVDKELKSEAKHCLNYQAEKYS